jgi:hypothetical protein
MQESVAAFLRVLPSLVVIPFLGVVPESAETTSSSAMLRVRPQGLVPSPIIHPTISS